MSLRNFGARSDQASGIDWCGDGHRDLVSTTSCKLMNTVIVQGEQRRICRCDDQVREEFGGGRKEKERKGGRKSMG
jgi:hypothetical protein